MERDIDMRQTVEEAAKEYYEGNNYVPLVFTIMNDLKISYDKVDVESIRKHHLKKGFMAGAEWQAKQSPWVRVKDRLPEKGEYDWVLVLLRDKRDGFIGIPEIGELREDGFWHTEMSDTFNTPSFRRTYNTTDVLGEFLNQEVIAWMPIPSFNEIIESNKDVLRRMKENGD
mgnify:CR=1 FL=1